MVQAEHHRYTGSPFGLFQPRQSKTRMTNHPANPNRYTHIDLLRGLAALLVVWMHTSEVFRTLLPAEQPGIWAYELAEAVDFGRIGVVAFFAISGFVIPSSFDPIASGTGLRRFFIRRFFRLFPAYWLSIPLGIWSAWYLWDKPVTAQQIFANLSMLPEALGYPPIEGLYWTLQLELSFYAICTLLYLRGWVHRPSVMAILAISLVGIFGIGKSSGLLPIPSELQFLRQIDQTPLYLAIMFWGALFRCWHDRHPLGLVEKVGLWLVPGTIVLLMPLFIGGVLSSRAALPPVWVKFLASHALGVLLFLSIALCRGLSSRLGAWTGEISYSIYLFHPVVFYPIYWLAGRTEWEFARQLSLTFWILICTLLSIAFAAITYRFVEKPAIGLAKKLTTGRAPALCPSA